ncbi:hypothetical protein TeGR_g10370, partial [Tetraparma gracilis]
ATMYDTQSTAKGSIMAYRAMRADHENEDSSVSLHSILGAARSDASKPMAVLGGIDGVPQLAYWSSSDALEDASQYPLFGRTIPPDSATSQAVAELMSELGYTYVGITYVDDTYGESYKDSFVLKCSEMKCKDALGRPTDENCPIEVVTSGLSSGNKESAENAIEVLRLADVRTGIFVVFDDDLNWAMDKALSHGMIGDDYFWIAGDGVMTQTVVARGNENPLFAEGWGRLTAMAGMTGHPSYDAFLSDWQNNFDEDAELKEYAESLFFDYAADSGSGAKHAEGKQGFWPEGTDLSILQDNFFRDNFPDDVASYAYDAVMAFGLGACDYVEAGGTFDDAGFDAAAYFQKITELSFESVSGLPYFLPSGSRDPASTNFVLENFKCPGGVCTSHRQATWKADTGFQDIVEGEPFVYADGTTTPPTDIAPPPAELDLALVIGGAAGGAVILALLIGAAIRSNEAGKRARAEANHLKVQNTMKVELTSARVSIEDLKDKLELMQSYSKKEQDMIENQIQTFRKDLRRSQAGRAFQGGGGGGGDEATTSDLDAVMSRLVLPAGEIETEEMIGKGSFGEVFKAKYKGQIVAVKTLKSIDEETVDRFKAEVLLSSDLRHANVVNMIGCCWEKNLMALVMEYCGMGTATDVLRREGKDFTWGDPLLKWATDVTRAMTYLHSVQYFDVKADVMVNGIIHRDLKPDNCLVTETYGVKIADFGESRALNEDQTMTQVGTPMFIAPEIVMGERYDGKADVYSYALTLLQFGLRDGKTLTNFLHEAWARSQAPERREAALALEPKPTRNTHKMISEGWRPNYKFMMEELQLPETIGGLIVCCWEALPATGSGRSSGRRRAG